MAGMDSTALASPPDETLRAALRAELESVKQTLDRLLAEREQAAPPAAPVAAPETETITPEPEQSRAQEIAEAFAAAMRKQLGSLPD